jgi:hypothetical protein
MNDQHQKHDPERRAVMRVSIGRLPQSNHAELLIEI